MGLLNPRAGETVDRITILDLKLSAAKRHCLDPKSFFEERLSLYNHLRLLRSRMADDIAYSKPFCESLEKFSTELATVNSELWELEDKIREKLSCSGEGEDATATDHLLAQMLRQQTQLNDKRSFLVKRISNLFGLQGEEKIYSHKG